MYSTRRFFVGAVGLTIALACGLPLVAAAQTPTSPATVLATVNIQNAKIVSQSGHAINVSFDLSNREGMQAGVQYAVQLVSETEKGQFVVDQKIYPDVLTLAEHSSVHKEVSYTAPPALSGSFTLLLVSRNDSGLPLALTSAGKVTLEAADATGIEIQLDSCYLTVAGELKTPHYTLSQGVDIKDTETLRLTCTATNRGATIASVAPLYKTHYRTTFGPIVEHGGGDTAAISFKASETKSFTLSLPKALEPQAYDVVVTLVGATGDSNPVTVHYVLRGSSATVQSISLDKDAYAAGDAAELSFAWSPSADGFPDSRLGAASPSAVSFAATLSDGSGTACADPIQGTLSREVKQHASFAVSKRCRDPQVSVNLVDASGAVLATKTIKLASANAELPTVALGLILFLVVIAGGVYVYAKKRVPPTPIAFKIFIPLLLLGGMWMPHQVSADTFSTYGTYGENAYSITFLVNIDKREYQPGETIFATGESSFYDCGNLRGQIILNASIPGVSGSQELFSTDVGGGGSAVYGATQFTAPSTPGTYEVLFKGETFVGVAEYAIPFTVPNAPPPPPTPQGSVTATPSCDANGYGQVDMNWNFGSVSTAYVQLTDPLGTPLVYQDFANPGSRSWGGLGLEGAYAWSVTPAGGSAQSGTVDVRNCSALTPAPKGFLDSATCEAISGWAYDPSSPNTSISVDLYADKPTGVDNNNGIIGRYPANLARPDVNAAGIPGNHGFSFATPAVLKDGKSHTLYMYAIGASGTTHGELSYIDSQILQCTPTTPETLCPDGTPAPGGDLTKCPTQTATCPDGTPAPGGDITKCPVTVTPPPAPVLSAACNTTTHEATFSWTAPAGATYYALRVLDTANSWTGTCSGKGNACYGDDGSLTASFKIIPGLYGNYDAWVHACNAAGCGPASNHATTSCIPPSSGDTCSVEATPAEVVAGDAVNVSWTSGCPAGGCTYLGMPIVASETKLNGTAVDATGATIDHPSFASGSSQTYQLTGKYYASLLGILQFQIGDDFSCSDSVERHGNNTVCPDGTPAPGGDLTRCPDGGDDDDDGNDDDPNACKQPTTKECSADGTYFTTYGADGTACSTTSCPLASAGFKCVENGGDAFCQSGPEFPHIDFNVSPTLIHKFDRTTVSWTASPAGSEPVTCTVDSTNDADRLDGWDESTTDGLSHAAPSDPIEFQTSYSLTCVGEVTGDSETYGPIPVYIIPDFQEI